MTTDISLGDVAELLRSADDVAILCHKNPDGDAIGSASAVAAALSHLGKRCAILCADTPSDNINAATGGAAVTEEPNFEPGFIMAVDVASVSLLGSLGEKYIDSIDLAIDHHLSNDLPAKASYCDHTAAACGEIIFEIVKLLGVPLNIAADSLYTAISTDTGGFRYSNTTSRTHRIIAEIIDSGADTESLNKLLYESRTQAEVRATSLVYDNLRYFAGGEVAAVVITEQMREKYKVSDHDTYEASSLLRQIGGVKLAVSVKQRDTDHYKISMRSEPPYEANTICAKLGGGGHLRAAGAEIVAKDENEALDTVLKAIDISVF